MAPQRLRTPVVPSSISMIALRHIVTMAMSRLNSAANAATRVKSVSAAMPAK